MARNPRNSLNVGAGLAIGIVIGLALDSLTMGIGSGLAIGIALSLGTKGDSDSG